MSQQRFASNDASKKQPATTEVGSNFKGATQDPMPHVSEEQAAIDKITGETPPDIEQGTPVQEVRRNTSWIIRPMINVSSDPCSRQGSAKERTRCIETRSQEQDSIRI